MQIVEVRKGAEEVVVRNTSPVTVTLEGWKMCSILGNQPHIPVAGVLAPGATLVLPSGRNPNDEIWRNDLKDDGALYDGSGRLVSYWSDPEPRTATPRREVSQRQSTMKITWVVKVLSTVNGVKR